MKKQIASAIKHMRKMIVFLIIGCSILTYAAQENAIKVLPSLEEELQQAVVLPVDYHNQIFIRGEYTSFYQESKIYSKDNTVYLPLRLVTYLISNDKERWDALWDANKPDEVTLTCTYMKKLGEGGWVSSNIPQTSIKFQIGRKEAIYNKKEIVLTAVPQKIEGKIVLPIKAVGEALNKSITYRDGLIFISDRPLTFEADTSNQIIKELKERLRTPNKTKAYSNMPLAVYHFHGQTYYMLYENASNPDTITLELYRQGPGQNAKLIERIENVTNLETPFVEDSFYYTQRNKDQVTLYALDLNTQKHRKLGELNIKDNDFSRIDRVIIKSGKVYFIVHYGDWTMGAEVLYRIDGNDFKKLVSAKQFGSIIINNDKIYYSDMKNIDAFMANNLFVYDEKTSETQSIGERGYTYDIDRVITSGGGISYGLAGSIKYLDNKLYTLGYLEESSETPSLYYIDLKSGEVRKIASQLSSFWIHNDRLYTIHSETRYLATSDLEGNDYKILVKDSIAQMKYYNGNFYYSKLNIEKDLNQGLYKYNLETNTVTRLSLKRIKDFFISSSGIYYVTLGYDAGLYKIQNGKTLCLEKPPIDSYQFDGEQIISIGQVAPGIKIIK